MLQNCCRCILNIFIRVLRGKNTWFPNFVAAGGWKKLTDESSGVKAKESGWLRDVYKDTDSVLRKQLLFS